MSEFRVPSIGDKVVVEGLVSASKHNGKSGTVVGYLLDNNRYKLKLKLSDDDDGGVSSRVQVKFLAVKRTNMRLADEVGGRDEAPAMHVLDPCHLNDERRL
jgi:hypothetical protein